MRYLLVLFLLAFVVLWSSCRNDFETTLSTGKLEFSSDTVFLDTVFTTIGTATYSFKVYNRSDQDITIPTVRLEEGEGSDYRLNVNGRAGKSFEDVTIFAQDSIFVFVESTFDIATEAPLEKEFLLTDKVLFDTGALQQDVDLVTLVKDAIFLFPQRDTQGNTESLLLGVNEAGEEVRIQGFFLDADELTFTKDKPYVIYGYAAVPSGQTMTIAAGARIHFHEASGLIVGNNATLLVNGMPSTDPEAPLENEVIFQGDRLGSGNIFDEESGSDFTRSPGQWGVIWLLPGNTTHQINHTTILNATAGLLLDANDGSTAPQLNISNSQIYNSATAGIIARNWGITAENLVINNSGQAAISCSYGGNYSFNHCTLTNYWTNSYREFPTVLLSNKLVTGPNPEDFISQPLQQADFINCIIYGNDTVEIGFDRDATVDFNFKLQHCLLRLDTSNSQIPEEDMELYTTTNTTFYEDIILNENPDFKDIQDDNMLNIGEESAANGQASIPGSGVDILGTARSATAPDIGAYESVLFEEE